MARRSFEEFEEAGWHKMRRTNRSLQLNPPGESLLKRACLLPARFILYELTKPDDSWRSFPVADSPDASIARSIQIRLDIARSVYEKEGIPYHVIGGVAVPLEFGRPTEAEALEPPVTE